MQANEVIDRVRFVLRDDPSQARWNDDELLLWLQDGCDAIGNASPDDVGIQVMLNLSDSNHQVLDVAYRRLLRLMRNTDGSTMRRVNRYAMQSVEGLYQDYNGAKAISDYWFDETSGTDFWVYPKPLRGVQVFAYVSPYQTVLNSLTSMLLVPSAYRAALVDYVLSAAYSKDADYANNLALASAYAQSFFQKTGIKLQGEVNQPAPENGQVKQR